MECYLFAKIVYISELHICTTHKFWKVSIYTVSFQQRTKYKLDHPLVVCDMRIVAFTFAC